ncbi:hypothetical protein CHS0354_041587 [Potamilus streckersoni]|uniref:15-oxoprostaglandin 13-reductase n=1 Tax=Potamilus streckersoni TaxID=2493646 RepID=A0AAE0VWA5_9BIVA|nr:hypothetical protein CHS0354_041587 [Potamilus streckersoni]
MTGCKNAHIIFINRPGVNSEPEEDNFRYEDCPTAKETLEDGEVLIQTMYLSVDPAMRCRMNKDTGVHYMQAWQLGETILGLGGIGRVLKSSHPNYIASDLVEIQMNCPWKLFFLCKPNDGLIQLQKIKRALVGDHPSLALSCLGLTGLTAYLGIKVKGNIKPGANQTLVVSGAAGATGSLAGQIGRLECCSSVVGLCGSDEKCKVLTEYWGFDHAINYKKENVAQRLKETCPDGIHLYFDNVGGEISDIVIQQMSPDSHVILCGQISVYNTDLPYPPPLSKNIQQILLERNITRDRFLVLNYQDQYESGINKLAQWLSEGKLKVKETVADGLKESGRAFVSMMRGGNIGKQIIHVSD